MMAFYIKKVKGQLHIDFPYFWCLYSTVTQEQKGDFFFIIFNIYRCSINCTNLYSPP